MRLHLGGFAVEPSEMVEPDAFRKDRRRNESSQFMHHAVAFAIVTPAKAGTSRRSIPPFIRTRSSLWP